MTIDLLIDLITGRQFCLHDSSHYDETAVDTGVQLLSLCFYL